MSAASWLRARPDRLGSGGVAGSADLGAFTIEAALNVFLVGDLLHEVFGVDGGLALSRGELFMPH